VSVPRFAGVKNEHFIVWMRTAALPKFRKLYGKLEEGLKKGDVLSFNIQNSTLVVGSSPLFGSFASLVLVYSQFTRLCLRLRGVLF
jgi:hypothetical protein